MVNRRQRSSQSQIILSPVQNRPRSRFSGEFSFKLKNLVSRHEKMKIAYQDLKSQINEGLLEAEEVFASLAIPLLKLVGLKTKEMAEEGRFTIIIVDDVSGKNGVERLEPDVNTKRKQEYQVHIPEVENYVNKATIAGKDLMVKQQSNFLQLVHLLRQIEIQVNFHQDNILESLGNHRASVHKFFQIAIYYISTLNSPNHDTVSITLKLLQTIFKNVDTVLASVEGGVEHLIQELAAKMCNPMMEYVKGLKDDMKNGTCVRLLSIVEEMERMMIDGKLEVEEARKKLRMAEEGKIEAICKLNMIEERVRKMKKHLSLPNAERGGVIEPCTPQKLLGMDEGQATDETLLWKLLKNKRKHQPPASPMGTEALLLCDANKRSCNKSAPVNSRAVARSGTRALLSQSPSITPLISLGSSPSLQFNQLTHAGEPLVEWLNPQF